MFSFLSSIHSAAAHLNAGIQEVQGSPPASPAAKYPPPLFDGSLQHAPQPVAADARPRSGGEQPQQEQPQPQALQPSDVAAGLIHCGSNMQELKQTLPSSLLRYPASDASQNMAALLAEVCGNGGGSTPQHQQQQGQLHHHLSNASHFSFHAPPAAAAGKRRRAPPGGEAASPSAQRQPRQAQQAQAPLREVDEERGAEAAAGTGPRASQRTKRRRTLEFAAGQRSGGDSPQEPEAGALDGGGEERAGGAEAGHASTPMHAMAAYALQQLPNMRGSLRQVATLIKHTAAFSADLDTSKARPGSLAQPRWKDALVAAFQAGGREHLSKTAEVDAEGHAIYALLPDKLTPKAAHELARCSEEAGAAAAAGGGSSGASAGGSAPSPAAAGALDTLTEVISALGEGKEAAAGGGGGGGDNASSAPGSPESPAGAAQGGG
eukprot:scaffold1.g5267.t1